MKKTVLTLMLLILLALSLTACKADTEDDAVVDAKTVSKQTWTYALLTYSCTYDNGSQDILCIDPVNEDHTMLANVIASKAKDGFELDEVISVPNGKSSVQTFIFRKAYTEPAAGAEE